MQIPSGQTADGGDDISNADRSLFVILQSWYLPILIHLENRLKLALSSLRSCDSMIMCSHENSLGRLAWTQPHKKKNIPKSESQERKTDYLWSGGQTVNFIFSNHGSARPGPGAGAGAGIKFS